MKSTLEMDKPNTCIRNTCTCVLGGKIGYYNPAKPWLQLEYSPCSGGSIDGPTITV